MQSPTREDILKVAHYVWWKSDMEDLLSDYGIEYSTTNFLLRAWYDREDKDDKEWIEP